MIYEQYLMQPKSFKSTNNGCGTTPDNLSVKTSFGPLKNYYPHTFLIMCKIFMMKKIYQNILNNKNHTV